MITAEKVPTATNQRTWVTPSVIAILLILRLVVLGLVSWLIKTRPEWLGALFEISTYLLTLFLIWWERDRLSEFHIGWLAVGIIITCKPLETLILRLWRIQNTGLTFPGLPALIIWAAAGILLVMLFINRPALRKIDKTEGRWFLTGLIAGIQIAIALAFPVAAQLMMEGAPIQPHPSLLGFIILPFASNFLYQLGYAAVSEEPLFRGFLWGYLRRVGWQDRWILLFQAALFMLSHIYYVDQLPYSFWIIVPFGALVMGWLAWRSRSIATSMAAHAAMNTLGYRLGAVAAYWFFR